MSLNFKFYKYYTKLLKLLVTLTLICFNNINILATPKVNKINNNINNKIIIKPQPLINKVQLYGRVMPLDTVDITAPTNSRIEKIDIQLGQKVNKDQILLMLTSDQLDIDIRNAKETLIRSEIEFNKKKSWLNSDDVFQARQSNIKNKLNYQRAQETYKQNQILFKQGIISLNELEQSEISFNDSKLNLELSDRHLKQIINQGNQTQLHLLQLSLDNARAKLDILEKIKQKLTIKSPIDGVILRATKQDKDTTAKNFLSYGQNVSNGENLLAIGNLNGFAVNVLVNEQVIQDIKLNQKVDILIPALENKTYDGIVTAIDAQPKDSDKSNSPPQYSIQVIANYSKLTSSSPDSKKSDLTENPNKTSKPDNIFLGMTAKISFNIIDSPESILIPFTSIAYDSSNQAYVIDSLNKTKKYIKLGKTTSNQIQVISGLHPGDAIEKSATT